MSKSRSNLLKPLLAQAHYRVIHMIIIAPNDLQLSNSPRIFFVLFKTTTMLPVTVCPG